MKSGSRKWVLLLIALGAAAASGVLFQQSGTGANVGCGGGEIETTEFELDGDGGIGASSEELTQNDFNLPGTGTNIVGPILPDEPTAPFGLFQGSFNVDHNGGAQYQIPIATPPGRNGVEPHLMLQYSSNGGQGHVGMGWSLEGVVSSIDRCPSTFQMDGFVRAVEVDENDNFCLDGMRLVGVRRLTNGVEFRTERDAQRMIIRRDTTINASQYYEVWTDTGLLLTYGSTAASQMIDGPSRRVVRYMLDRIRDRFGNYMSIEYEKRVLVRRESDDVG